METKNDKPKKPMVLRIIFILNAILMFLPFVFYYAITTDKLDVGGLDPNIILYTAAGYILAFIAMVFFILKRNLLGFRSVFVATILMSIPASGFIGILVALISLALSFHKQLKTYFRA